VLRMVFIGSGPSFPFLGLHCFLGERVELFPGADKFCHFLLPAVPALVQVTRHPRANCPLLLSYKA